MPHPAGPRTFDPAVLTLAELLQARTAQATTVSVCIPARDEARTIGHVVRTVGQAHLAAEGGSGLVDEIIVVDDRSKDDTAAVAEQEGARVVRTKAGGKGQAMAVAAEEARGDIVVFLDADVKDTTAFFATRLVGPILLTEEVVLTKGFYRRPLGDAPSGGGRVTELLAGPFLDVCYPELAAIRQPLAGETAIRRPVLDKLTLAPGYGVELALLLDVAQRFGPGAIAQVDLGVRTHRNRPLEELRPQAMDILRAGLERLAENRRANHPETQSTTQSAAPSAAQNPEDELNH